MYASRSAYSVLVLFSLIFLSASADGQNQGTRPALTALKTDSTLVLVPVAVTDRHAGTVSGLRPETFRLFEDHVLQQKYSISEEDVPASIGIILDVSGSMEGSLSRATEALQAFVSTANPEDEVFLYTVSTRPGVGSTFTRDLESLVGNVRFANANGDTALVDTIYSALLHMRSAKNSRRALLVISDGMDNHSRYTKRELIEQALETDAQIFCITVYDPPGYAKPIQLQEQRQGLRLMEDLSSATGGVALRCSGK